ncbi:hypothetical protein [Chromobacterium violaceum]|uniref:hypothetical protein n=1 Tax=Chromobacterium violaceum TaxID=536 RepID=UPI0015F80374|nr:hypothetical protein [Chromobacterium violaceum]MBA8734197.1 hypothetical protein [Chromobacterium violaceum]
MQTLTQLARAIIAADRAGELTDELFNEFELALDATEQSGEVTITTNDRGECVAVTRQDEDGRILSVIWEAKPTTEQSGEAVAHIRESERGRYLEPVKRGFLFDFEPGTALHARTPQPAPAVPEVERVLAALKGGM